jgi:hypothetical protein
MWHTLQRLFRGPLHKYRFPLDFTKRTDTLLLSLGLLYMLLTLISCDDFTAYGANREHSLASEVSLRCLSPSTACFWELSLLPVTAAASACQYCLSPYFPLLPARNARHFFCYYGLSLSVMTACTTIFFSFYWLTYFLMLQYYLYFYFYVSSSILDFMFKFLVLFFVIHWFISHLFIFFLKLETLLRYLWLTTRLNLFPLVNT